MSKTSASIVENSGESHGWARPWLESVAASARAIEREKRAQEFRRHRADRIAAPSTGSIHGKGGKVDRTAASDAFVDGEDALRGGPASFLAEHYERIEEFNRAMNGIRSGTADAINAATYAAECRYAMGYSERRAAEVLEISQSTLRMRVALIVDYLNHVGPAAVGVRL